MKKIFVLIIALLTLFIATSCELFMQEPAAGKVYAIFMALDYQVKKGDGSHGDSQKALHGTINDAKTQLIAFEKVATRAGLTFSGYSFLQIGNDDGINIEIGSTTVNSYPTLENLQAAITALRTITTDNDLILFTFSGHAIGGGIALKESMATKPIHDLIEAETLLDLFSNLKGRKLIILDACETGLAIPHSQESSSTLLENSISKWYAKYFSQTSEHDRSLYVMSSSAGTDSYEAEFNGKSYGVFTQALLKGLGWDFSQDKLGSAPAPAIQNDRLTTDGLLRYIKEHQAYPYKRSLTNTNPIQHPMVTGGARDMVIFTF
ncbi:MAG: caspase family protein [Sphaerochaeta sp.]|jgi:hypothetical protein